MEKMATIGEKKDTENTKSNAIDVIGVLFVIIVVVGIGLLLFFSVESRNKPPHLISEAISSVDKLQERLKGRMLVMEKDGYSDTAYYKHADEIKVELQLVHDKLIEIKVQFKDKPWAN